MTVNAFVIAQEQTRLERSLANVDRPILDKVATVFGSALTAYETWMQRRNDIQTLRDMNDRMLADIGLSRSDVERMIQQGR